MSRFHFSRHFTSNPAIETLENRLYRSADLTGIFPGNTPSILEPADRNRVGIEVENTGDTPAVGSVTVDLSVASDSSANDGRIPLASATRHVKLEPGGNRAVKLRFAEPAGIAAGSYSLIAQIDAGDIPAAIATNDVVVAPSPVQVKQPFVDLRAQNVQGPIKPVFIDEDIVSGGPASVLVANHGTGLAKGTLSVDFYLTTDSTLDNAAFLAGQTPGKLIALQPGRSEKFSASLEPPAATASGDYFLFAVLAPGGGIVQTNSGDEVGEAAHQVIVVRGPAPATQQPPVAEIYYGGPTVTCVPGGDGETTACGPSDSTVNDSSTPPCTSPATCPATAPATNSDTSQGDSQPLGNDDPQQSTPAQVPSDSSNSSDSSPSDPQQTLPVDASVPTDGDGQSDSTGGNASDASQTPTSDASDDSGQSDGSGGDDGSDGDDSSD